MELDGVPAQVALLPAGLQHHAALRKHLEQWKPQGCVHLAWCAEPGRYLEAPENVESLDATLALLRTLTEVGCRSVAAAGTCAEYDTDGGWLREDTPLRPRTLYAAAKASAGMMAQQLTKGGDTTVAWGRIFYPYGPLEDRRRAVPALMLSLLEGRRFAASAGEQVRDYIHVSDVADALITLMDSGSAGAFNVSSGVPITMRSLMEAIGEQVGRTDLIDFGELPYRSWDPMFICGDNSRLKALGWAPKVTLQRGLQETIAWWRSQL
jgi:nucleoside-diphosphate-sugar epimerase